MYFWCSLATKIRFQNKDKYSCFLSAAKRSLRLSENLASCWKKDVLMGKVHGLVLIRHWDWQMSASAWPRKQFPSFPQGV